MAINPPYRIDPLQNIVNVNWGAPGGIIVGLHGNSDNTPTPNTIINARVFSAAGSLITANKAIDIIDTAGGVAMDTNGNVFVAGGDQDAILTVSRGVVARLTKAGALSWLTDVSTGDLGDTGGAYVRMVACDPNGDAIIVYTDGVSPNLASKLDGATGSILWTIDFGDSDTSHSTVIPVDNDGNWYVAGFASDGSYLKKLSATGATLWTSTETAQPLACDINNNVFVSDRSGLVTKRMPTGDAIWTAPGYFGDVAGTDLYVAGDDDGSVSKYNKDGVLQWSVASDAALFLGNLAAVPAGVALEMHTVPSDDPAADLVFLKASDGSETWRVSINDSGKPDTQHGGVAIARTAKFGPPTPP